MAKKGKKKNKGAKLPKTIAGVKLPRQLREHGGAVVEALRHPVLADLVAAALVGAAGALRDKATASGKSPDAPAPSSGRKTGDAVAMIGTMLAAKAVDGVRRMAADAETKDKKGDRGGE